MGSKNQYVLSLASTLRSSVTFAPSVDDSATTAANIQSFMDLLASDGSGTVTNNLTLDQMSPAARAAVYSTLGALKKSVTGGVAGSLLSNLILAGGTETLDASVTTDTAGESLYLVVVANGAATPSAAQIAAGNNASGSAAIASVTISAGAVVSGANAFAQITGLTPATYDVHVAQGSTVVSGGATVSAATTSTATLTEFSDAIAPFDSGAARGLNAATIPLSLASTDAQDGDVVEIKWIEYTDDNDPSPDTATGVEGPIQEAGTISGGAWFGKLTGVPRNVGTYYRAAVHIKGSAAPWSVMTNRFFSGHVFAFWEQSNGSRLFSGVPDAGLYESLVSENDVFIVARQSSTTTSDSTVPGDYELVPVNSATAIANSSPVSPAAVAMANAFSAARLGEKLLIVAQTEQGTHPADALTTDAENAGGTYGGAVNTGRNHLVDRAIHDAATRDGTSIGAIFTPGWIESVSNLPSIVSLHTRLAIGRNLDGTKVDISDAANSLDLPRLYLNTYADGSNLDAGGHDLRTAYEASPGDAEISAGGLYDMSVTRWAFFGPHGDSKRSDLGQVPPAADVTDIAQLQFYGTEDANYETLVMEAKTAFTGAGSNFPEALPYVGVTHGAQRSNDEVHMEVTADGRSRLAKLWMFNAMKAAGMLPGVDQPVLNLRYDPPSGAYADFGIVGRDVTTERLRRGDAPIAQIGATGGNQDSATGTNTPHRTEVMGWAINRVAAPHTEIHTVTATDVSNGHTAAEGQKVCRVYAPTGQTFSWDDSFLYGAGRLPEIMVAEDYTDGAYLNLLVADMGQPAEIIPAIPVQIGSFGMPASTLTAPDLFKVNDSDFRSTSAGLVLGSREKLYAGVQMRIDAGQVGSNGHMILWISADHELQITGDGRVALTDNADGVTVQTDANYVAPGVWFEVAAVIDRSAGTPKIELLDGSGNSLDTQTITAKGAFTNALTRMWLLRDDSTRDPINATMSYLHVWLGQVDDTGNPTLGFTGKSDAPARTAIDAGAALFIGGDDFEFNGTNNITPGTL